jgi:hypothetical protein
MGESRKAAADLINIVGQLDRLDPDEIRAQMRELDGEREGLSRLLHVVLGRRRAKSKSNPHGAIAVS